MITKIGFPVHSFRDLEYSALGRVIGPHSQQKLWNPPHLVATVGSHVAEKQLHTSITYPLQSYKAMEDHLAQNQEPAEA